MTEAKKLTKWWLEWDPTNGWLQVGGKILQENGKYNVWITGPIETAYGPSKLETFNKTRYILDGEPGRLEKWLTSDMIQEKFRCGFPENWTDIVSAEGKKRLTRRTPHKVRPQTPVEEMQNCDLEPLAEDQSLISNLDTVRKALKTPKSPPKIVRRRARQTKAKKANLDPLSQVALAKPVAKFNYVDPSPDPSPVTRKRRKVSSLATKSTSRKSSRKAVVENPGPTPRATYKTGTTRISPREKKNIKYTEPKSSTTVESIDLKDATANVSREKSAPKKAKATKKATKKVEEEPEKTMKTVGKKTKKQPSKKPAAKLVSKNHSISEDDNSKIEEDVKPKKVRGPYKKKTEPTKKKPVAKSESTREKPAPKKKTKVTEPESSFELTKSDIETDQSKASSKITEPALKSKRPRKRTIEDSSRDAASPLPLPKVPKKKPSPMITKKAMKEKLKAARRLDNVEFQSVTPERKNDKEKMAFTTPKHSGSRPNSANGFSTPSVGGFATPGGFQTPSTSGNQQRSSGGGFATPLINQDPKNKPKKFTTPKQTDAQLDRVLKNRNVNQKKIVKKSRTNTLLTPKNTKQKKRIRGKLGTDMIIPEIDENSATAADEEVENYFN